MNEEKLGVTVAHLGRVERSLKKDKLNRSRVVVVGKGEW